MTQTRWEAKLGFGILFGAISILIGVLGMIRVGSADQQPETSKISKAEKPRADEPVATQAPKMRKIMIRGECLDDKSNPIPDVAIRVYRYKDFSEPPALVTSSISDSDGRFKIEDVEQAADRDFGDLVLAASAARHASIFRQIHKFDNDSEIELTLSSNPQTLFGVVTDINGRPVPNVLVSQISPPFCPLPDVLSAITDEQGRYEITDATEWAPQNQQGFTKGIIQLRHPDFPLTKAYYKKIPQEVKITLKPPAIVEGRVIDATTNEPVPNITVSAQGVARYGWFRATTDGNGRYRLRMTKDHYNIWAEMDERIAIAVKAIEAVPGETATEADVRMVKGGFVVGALINGETNERIRIPEEQKRYIGNHGPARPFVGAAVQSTKVNPDGTYRLRVAPGLNYVYFMGGDMADYVVVKDGEEIKLDLVSGISDAGGIDRRLGPDQALQSRLVQKAEEEDADEAAANEN